jgi:hypothetical protein
MEEREENSDVKAASLIHIYQKLFYKISYTVHPQGIPGEAQGKSSNESWAAKQACKDYLKELAKHSVIVTVMDGESKLFLGNV